MVGEEVGRASAIKMIRSVMVKGLEALSNECAAAAEAAGVFDEVMASLDASEKAAPWADKVAYNRERMATHGLRRAAEMEESAKTLQGLGIEPVMTRGTVKLQREAAQQAKFTPLESDLLNHFHTRFADKGFPDANALTMRKRRNTGAGRFTYLEHSEEVDLPNGSLGLGKYSQVNMPELEAGASFWVQMENSKIDYLEIVVNGSQSWDGSESSWDVCDPDTGEFPSNKKDQTA
jgi:hypothetical protein